MQDWFQVVLEGLRVSFGSKAGDVVKPVPPVCYPLEAAAKYKRSLSELSRGCHLLGLITDDEKALLNVVLDSIKQRAAQVEVNCAGEWWATAPALRTRADPIMRRLLKAVRGTVLENAVEGIFAQSQSLRVRLKWLENGAEA